MIRELHDEILAVLQAEENLDVYAVGTVPNLPPTPYVVVDFSRRGVGARVDRDRLSDQLTGVGWRIGTLHVGATARETEWAEDRVAAALEGLRFNIDGQETTPLHFEAPIGVEPDPGVEDMFTSASTWTCVSTALQPA